MNHRIPAASQKETKGTKSRQPRVCFFVSFVTFCKISSALGLALTLAFTATAQQNSDPGSTNAPPANGELSPGTQFPPGAQVPPDTQFPLTNGALETQEITLSNVLSAAQDMLGTNDVNEAMDPSRANGSGGEAAQNDRTQWTDRRYNGRQSRQDWMARQRDRARSSSSPAAPGASTSTNTPNKLDYAYFRTIVDLNIFNPNRQPRRRGGEQQETIRPNEYFTLVGTMTYEKGTFAFFDGSSSRYQKALKAADSIAGYKLTAITDNAVKLALGTNQIEMTMGMQMRRQDEGDWYPSRAPADYAANTSSSSSARSEYTSSSTTSTTSSSSTPAPSGGDADTLKKMMQRREQE